MPMYDRITQRRLSVRNRTIRLTAAADAWVDANTSVNSPTASEFIRAIVEAAFVTVHPDVDAADSSPRDSDSPETQNAPEPHDEGTAATLLADHLQEYPCRPVLQPV